MSIEKNVVRELRAQGYTVLNRKEWGSKHRALYQWRRVNRRFVGPADHAFAHITVTRPSDDPKVDAQVLESIGMARFGSGISYNWALHKPSKTIILGQPHDAAGTHTVNDKNVPGFHDNLNYWGHAIAFIGWPGDVFDEWCVDAAAAIIRAERKHGAMKAEAHMYPHSKFAWKDCPCDSYRDQIPDIERKASEKVRDAVARLRKLRKARRKRGLLFPGEVTVRVVNLASVSSGPKKVAEVLEHALSGDVDLVLAVECSDIRVRDHVDRTVWQVLQYGANQSEVGERIAMSGNALIARRATVALDRGKLKVGSPAGEGIRTRYLLSARAKFHVGKRRRWRSRITVGHAPPGRAPVGRERLINAIRSLVGIKGGDLNVSGSTARQKLSPAKVRTAGVLHLSVPWWMPASKAKRFDIGSDHKALEVVLFPRRFKK